MKKFIATSCEFMLHEDDWNEGEGDLIACWNEDVADANSIEELLRNVNYLDKNYSEIKSVQAEFANDPCYDGDLSRFDADLTVDIETDSHYDGGFRIIKPTEEKWKQFEAGKVKLYALHIIVHVKKVAELDADDLKAENWN